MQICKGIFRDLKTNLITDLIGGVWEFFLIKKPCMLPFHFPILFFFFKAAAIALAINCRIKVERGLSCVQR